METKVISRTRTRLAAGAAIGAAIILSAGAGGYLAVANAEPVNAHPASYGPGAPTSFADIIEKVAPAVVSVDVEGKADPSKVAFSGRGANPDDGQGGAQGLPFGFDFRQLIPQQPDGKDLPPMQGTGSGFFISADGYIVTNNHVVEGADKITVRTKDERELKARVIGRDPATDLAVIKVEGANFPFVDFEESAKPRVGDWVVAVGNPFNLGGTATAGIVSALARDQRVSGSSYVDYMQIDAPINRGNSGGPTFDMNGRVVGVNSAIFSPSGGSVGIGFDIPADVAASITRQLITDGKVTRGYVGATIQDITPEIGESMGLPAHHGALVADLTHGGPAEQAGLKPGDLVMRVNGHEVTSASDMTRQVALAHAGESLRLDIRRDGRPSQIDVKSGVRPSEALLAKANLGDDDQAAPQEDAPPLLGMQLSPKAGGGMTIQRLLRSSDAAQKGLQPGDVILKAGDQKADSAKAVADAADAARKGGRKDVLLMVARNGRTLFIPVKVAEAAAEG